MELLVVITIIGILIALLLPAIQAARESARRLQCTNHLKQISLACMAHEGANKFLPTGGWGFRWAGQPTRGFDNRQPGGWLYNILPYMDMQSLHDLGGGLDQQEYGSPEEVKVAMQVVQRVSTPVTMFYCPSRRSPTPCPYLVHYSDSFRYNPGSIGSLRDVEEIYPKVQGLTDYAANGGDTKYYGVDPGHVPPFLADGDGWPECSATGQRGWDSLQGYHTTGVVYVRSMVKIADIKDGTSNTYLAGEKYAIPDHYTDGTVPGDHAPWDMGWAWANVRWTGWDGDRSDPNKVPNLTPTQDCPEPVATAWAQRTSTTHCYAFGSAHAAGFNMAFCDGSVHVIGYTIDKETHHRLGDIADGQPVDAKAF